MKMQVIQHVGYEGPGHIIDVCRLLKIDIHTTNIFMGEEVLPDDDFDILIIMGGPMSVNDEEGYPWLKKEKIFIEKAIDKGKLVFGFCLGAQLIASVLGSDIGISLHREIGWFPVKRQASMDVLGFLPDIVTVFHWHSETFSLPKGAIRLYSSEVVQNQAFIYQDHVLALQFHPEMTIGGMNSLIHYCGEELTDEPYIMNEEALRKGYQRFHHSGHRITENIFRYFLRNHIPLEK